LFIPEEGAHWGAFDYSQQEPRITVHYASLLGLTGADEAVEAYSSQDADFHQIVADMANIPRKQAKDINLGLTYGMGKDKLIRELGLETLLKRSFTYKALNRLIQGSAADMTKLAMLDLWKEGLVPHLQIHDELDFSVRSEEEAEIIIDRMVNCVELKVPLVVDYEKGQTWGDAK
jgi:DNA polymerase I-like protein with 3'-5' exonuclease and polymerase domains